MGKANITKLRMNSDGVLAILKSAEVQADLLNRGEAIHGSLPTSDGEEWVVNSFVGKDRAQVVVKTGNTKARRAAAEGVPLQSALGSGR